MTNQRGTIVALDVGTSRIGVAKAPAGVSIAVPLETVTVDGTEQTKLAALVAEEKPEIIVVGYPRNQSGEPTKQTAFVEQFAKTLTHLGVPIVFQDESLTSVEAEQRLAASGKPYTKGVIDAEAATIILQDYLELGHGY